MRCGRILVEGEAEEFAVSPRSGCRQRHGKKSNPYSTRGLDKFESVYAELSARREYFAKKTGVPENLVRFAYSKNGWTPVVVRAGDGIEKKNGGENAAGVSIPRPVVKKNGEKDGESRREYEANETNGNPESISISVFDDRSHSLVMPCSRFLKATAFGVLGLSAMWARRSAVSPALAMATAMAMGGVMCMRKFIFSGVSIFQPLFRNPRDPKTIQNGGGIEAVAEKKEAIAENKDVDELSRKIPRTGLTSQNGGGVKAIAMKKDVDELSRRIPKAGLAIQNGGGIEAIADKKNLTKLCRRNPRAGLLTVSAPCSPMRAHVQPTEFSAMASPRGLKPKEVNHEHKHHHHHHNHSKPKIIRRIVTMDTKPARAQGSDIFYRRTRPGMAYDPSVGATSLIITLFCLIFYGRLCAILFTSAWWYLLPMFCQPSEMVNTNNNNSRVVDLQSSEYRKKALMDGLLGRKPN